VVLTKPFAEPAHGDFQFLHRRGSIGQLAGGQPFAGHGLHPWRQDQRRLPGRHQLAWLGGDLAPVEQHHLQLVQMGDPLLGGMLEEALLACVCRQACGVTHGVRIPARVVARVNIFTRPS